MQKNIVISSLALLILVAMIVVAAWSRSGMSYNEIEAMTGLARMYCNEGDYDQAVQLYHEIMKKSGNSPFVRMGLASAFFEKGDFEKAEEQYRILLEADKDSAIVVYNLGQTLYSQGRVKEAGRYFTRFLEEYGNLIPELAQKARVILAEIH